MPSSSSILDQIHLEYIAIMRLKLHLDVCQRKPDYPSNIVQPLEQEMFSMAVNMPDWAKRGPAKNRQHILNTIQEIRAIFARLVERAENMHKQIVQYNNRT